MKKIILGVITCLLSLSVFGQVNEFKFGFPLRANGGLNVGTDKVQLDSIVRDGTTIKFYTGVTELLPNMAGGSVTSVGMTVPTGLSISGSPITGSGTLALTFAPGYSIPSDASQSNWNTAYNWGDHVLGGYQSQSDILDDFAALTNSAGVLTNNGSGGLTWTAVGGIGTVTSVALSVPTGLSISGSPITSSGTLAISLASGYSIPSTSVQSNWTTAYNERAQWDGGSTNLVASTGRTSLGATTVGSNLFTLNNPNAIRFIQINANNTVSALTATDLKTALSLTASDVSLGNVTNESKTTMFTSPIFTGVAPRLGSPVTDTLATQSYARSVGGSGGVTLETVQGEISDSLNARIGDGVELSDVAVMIVDSTGTAPGSYISGYTFTQAMQNHVAIADSTGNAVGNYVTRKALIDSITANLGGLTSGDVAGMINDSLLARLDDAVAGVLLADSTGNSAGNYVTYTRMVNYVEANAGSAEGITLNSGTITLTGDAGTADDISFYTNGDGQYNLPSGGGNLTIMSEVQGWISDSLEQAWKNDSDTIPLFIFGAGSGFSADTALFNNNRLAGAFYNSGSDTLYVTELRGVLVEGTGTETIDVQVSWDVNMKDATPTNLNTAAVTITSMTTGTADTSFDNNGIPPSVWVWCTLSGASSGNKPTMLILTMTGYKRNRSY